MEKIKPNRKYFETQKADEEVLIIVRRHWTVYAPAFLVTFLVVSAMTFAYFFSKHIEIFAQNQVFKAITTCCFSLFLLFTALFFYINWLVNYLNIQIVTNQHIVDISQLGLFSRKISELALSEIQDISATKKGIFETFYDFGDINVQTAGEKPNFNFERVPDPDGLSQRIMEIRDKYGHGESGAGQTGSQPVAGQQNAAIVQEPVPNEGAGGTD